MSHVSRKSVLLRGSYTSMNGIINWLPAVAAGRPCLESRIQLTVLSASDVHKFNSCQRQPIQTMASIGVEKDGQTECQIRQVMRSNTQTPKQSQALIKEVLDMSQSLDIKFYLWLGLKPAAYKGSTCYGGPGRNIGLFQRCIKTPN